MPYNGKKVKSVGPHIPAILHLTTKVHKAKEAGVLLTALIGKAGKGGVCPALTSLGSLPAEPLRVSWSPVGAPSAGNSREPFGRAYPPLSRLCLEAGYQKGRDDVSGVLDRDDEPDG
jgi:hypothetical protein